MKFLQKFRKTVMFIIKLIIVFAMTLGFISVWYNSYPETIYSRAGNYVVLASYLLVFSVFAELYGGFKIGIHRLHEIVYSLSLSALIANVLMYMELSLIARQMLSVWPMFWGLCFQVMIIFIGSYCANQIYFCLYPARRILAVFADDEEGRSIIRKMSRMPQRFSIERGVSVLRASVEEIKELIDNYEAVLLCEFDKDKKNELLHYCYVKRKRAYLLPSSTEVLIRATDQIQISDTPILMCRSQGIRPEYEMIKRFFDFLVAAIGLIIAAPFMIIIAVAIKINDRGPVFFRQNRVTKDGKIFNVLKFRSMIVDADKDGAKKAETDDDRITKVGKVIRAIRMDELPQLINILKGDMSLVGPRPERLENVYEYSRLYPDFDLRHRVKGGLTGYAQIYGKYNTRPEDKLKMDLIYIEQYSPFLDFKLLLMTVKILFMKESTEGFDQKANANLKKHEKRIVEENDNNG